MGNPVGRPPIHTDPAEVERLCNEYFEALKGRRWNGMPEPPTVTGLALHLGFCDKSTLYDYRDKPEFSHSIKKALSKIEQHHEFMVAGGDKCTGNIFALKNMGWADKVETKNEHYGELKITRRIVE